MALDREKGPNGRGRTREAEGGQNGGRRSFRILPFRGVLRESVHRACSEGPRAGFEEVTWIVRDPGRSLRAGPHVTLAPN